MKIYRVHRQDGSVRVVFAHEFDCVDGYYRFFTDAKVVRIFRENDVSRITEQLHLDCVHATGRKPK